MACCSNRRRLRRSSCGSPRAALGARLALAASLFSCAFLQAAVPFHPATQAIEGEAIVTFKTGADLPSALRALQRHSLQFARHFEFLSGKRGKQFGLVRDTRRTAAQLIAELSKDPEVEIAEPNYLRWISSAVPNDALFSQLWALRNTGQAVKGMPGTPGDDIKFLSAWSMARTSSPPVVVAVIDTGIDYTHPDLAPSLWVNPGEIPANGLDDDGDGYIDDVYGYDFADAVGDPFDSGVHGSHVSGTIAAAANNGLGIDGVDYQAKIMALKASADGNTFSSAAVIEAIQYAAMMKGRGANIAVINASFGGGGSNSTERAAIEAAGGAGIIFCAAAGNSTLNHDVTADYPSSYRLPNMIVVAASDQSDQLASFSDYGATNVDLAAPGVNILSTVPVGTSAYVSQGSSTFSAQGFTFSGHTAGLTGTIYDCGLGYSTNFPPAVRNNIALIARGTLYFSQKVANAMAAGASAAVIYNNAAGNFSGTLQFASNWIPALSISQADGLTLQSLVPATATVVNVVDPSMSYELLDGTSMAAPHVSAAVAFAAMNFPSETVPQRVQRVLGNVDVVPGLQGKVLTGGRLNLLRIVDTDRNGLPDWWEQIYFGHLTGTDPAADPDHDGASNLAEWLAGTNPTNAASALRLLPTAPSVSNAIIVRWESVAGKSYTLERATNLLSGFNSVVRSNIVATPPINSEPDTAIPAGNTLYYRIRLE